MENLQNQLTYGDKMININRLVKIADRMDFESDWGYIDKIKALIPEAFQTLKDLEKEIEDWEKEYEEDQKD